MSAAAHVLDRLSADPDAKAFDILVLAALDGQEALKQALDTQTPQQPTAVKPRADAPPPRVAYLKTIAVEGFRGIGPRAELGLHPGPGLTLVVGRNGSGKSSFAEALEQLLTGDTYRWKKRTKVWREGWRNLHHAPAAIEAEVLLEGEKGETRITETWAEGADLDAGLTTVQVHGKPRSDLTSLGWDGPLETYRPFLSYSELGALLDEGPSKLFDALAQILGLDALIDAEKALAEERKSREKPLKEAGQARQQIVEALGQSDDPRAKALLDTLKKKAWSEDEADTLLAGDTRAGPDVETRTLQKLAQLQAPPRDQAERVARALRESAAKAKATAGTLAKKSKDLADILDLALAFHDAHGDQDCPVCGHPKALDTAWHAKKHKEAAELKQVASEATKAEAQADAARKRAAQMRLLQELQPARGVEAETERAQQARADWNAGLDAADLEALAAHVEKGHPAVEAAYQDLQNAALRELQKKEDAWKPVAEHVRQWLAVAKPARRRAEPIPRLKAAEEWLKHASHDLRNQRFAPIKQQAQAIWKRLRMQSNVDLEDIRLAGSSTRRNVELDVSVDGQKGAALGVMSQGELHALALSLFVPRATLDESPFRFLVIDDPVQSMDPARVDGLAQVLHDTAQSRQVVVFTHDDRLPEAIRRLQIPATTIEVVRREQSVVEPRPAKGPVERYIEDAIAVAKASGDGLPEKAARRVVPGLCRLAIDAACTEVVRRRRLGRGERHADVEQLLTAASGSKALAALALFDDETRAGDVLGHLNKQKRDHADVFRIVNEGAHELQAAAMLDIVRQSERLAQWILGLK